MAINPNEYQFVSIVFFSCYVTLRINLVPKNVLVFRKIDEIATAQRKQTIF